MKLKIGIFRGLTELVRRDTVVGSKSILQQANFNKQLLVQPLTQLHLQPSMARSSQDGLFVLFANLRQSWRGFSFYWGYFYFWFTGAFRAGRLTMAA